MNWRNLKVGDALPSIAVEPITRKTLALFAGASGDHQPTHIDIDAARLKGRDDVIAHGMLIMAYMSRLLIGLVPPERLRSFQTRFVAFTPVHAEPTIGGEVIAVEGSLATVAIVARLADGKPVAIGEAVIDIG